MKSLKSAIALREVIKKMATSIEGVDKKSFESIVQISIYKDKIEHLKQVVSSLTSPTQEIETSIEEDMLEVEPEDELTDPPIEVTLAEEEESKKKSIASEQNWLKHRPDVRWKLDKGSYPSYYKTGMMVSDEGDVWDLMSDSLVEVGFFDGEMKAVIPGDRFCTPERGSKTMRIAPMVARLYGVQHAADRTGATFFIDYIDGDRRNLKPSNLKWVKRPLGTTINQRELAKIIADDICRRLVDNNGDVEKTLSMYPSDSTNINSKYISDIRFKLIETGLSDKYFNVGPKGEFIPKSANKNDEKPVEEKPVIDMSMMSDELLESKIRTGKLAIADKNLILYKVITSLKNEGVKKLTAEIVVDAARDKYKISLPTDMADIMLNGGLV